MDFTLDEASRRLQAEVAAFAKKEMPKADRELYLMIDQECSDFEFEMSMSKKLARRGWLTMSWPKEYGGGRRKPFRTDCI